MEVIIETGFAKITHNLPVYPQGTKLGQKLIKSGHVNVREIRCGGISNRIEGVVCRQTLVHKEAYGVNLYVS